MPDVGRMSEIREPIVTVHLYMPQESVQSRHDARQSESASIQMNMAYITARQVMLTV